MLSQRVYLNHPRKEPRDASMDLQTVYNVGWAAEASTTPRLSQSNGRRHTGFRPAQGLQCQSGTAPNFLHL